eukprot:g38982.t1
MDIAVQFLVNGNPRNADSGGFTDSPTLLIFGHLVRRGAGRSEDLLFGLLLGLAKLAINRFRQWAMERTVTADSLPLFCGHVCAQVTLEEYV